MVKSHYMVPQKTNTWLERKTVGSYRCGNCKACTYMLNTKEFSSPATGIEYHIRDFCNCRSKGVVYMARCECPLIYVRKTIRELRRLVLEHIGDIPHHRDTALARHMRNKHPEINHLTSGFVPLRLSNLVRGEETLINSYYKKRQHGYTD